MNDKTRCSLIAGTIGDAVGYQIEFQRGIKDKEVTDYKDKGMISDDTKMNLFTANALIWRETRKYLKGITTPYNRTIFWGNKDWLNTQYNLTNNEGIC